VVTTDSVDWSQAICHSGKYDPELWFGETDAEQAQAVILCTTGGPGGMPCPIREKCLHHALSTGEVHGVWGGLTEKQRRVTGWAKQRIRCPGCKSTGVSTLTETSEACLRCGLSWKI